MVIILKNGKYTSKEVKTIIAYVIGNLDVCDNEDDNKSGRFLCAGRKGREYYLSKEDNDRYCLTCHVPEKPDYVICEVTKNKDMTIHSIVEEIFMCMGIFETNV